MGERWDSFKRVIGLESAEAKAERARQEDLRHSEALEAYHREENEHFDYGGAKLEAEQERLYEERTTERGSYNMEVEGIAKEEEKLKQAERPKTDFDQLLNEAAKRGSNRSLDRGGPER
jgi:hypothetical protein